MYGTLSLWSDHTLFGFTTLMSCKFFHDMITRSGATCRENGTSEYSCVQLKASRFACQGGGHVWHPRWSQLFITGLPLFFSFLFLFAPFLSLSNCDCTFQRHCFPVTTAFGGACALCTVCTVRSSYCYLWYHRGTPSCHALL